MFMPLCDAEILAEAALSKHFLINELEIDKSEGIKLMKFKRFLVEDGW